MNMSTLKTHFSKERLIYVTGHIHPDGDCVGSALGFYNYMVEEGYKVKVFLEEKPGLYDYIDSWDSIVTLGEFQEKAHEFIEKEHDMVVLDSGDKLRFEPFDDLFESAKVKVNIDHHASNINFADINIVDVHASSTCELLGILMGLDSYEAKTPSLSVATALYTGIVYDTGVFKHDNTRKQTHLIAAILTHAGVDHTSIINRGFFTKSYTSLKAIELAISNLGLFDNEAIGVTYLTRSQMNQLHITKGHTESIVNLVLEIDTVQLSCFLIEMEENVFKASLRSGCDVDVCKIASAFGGGGHIKAAGCTIKGNLEEVKDRLVKELMKAYERNH